jgi:hypothetical protein
MGTPLEPAHWVCGICGATAAELASPLHPPLDGPSVIRRHVREVHGVTVEELQDSLQAGRAWSLPDGRVWMREMGLEEA